MGHFDCILRYNNLLLETMSWTSQKLSKNSITSNPISDTGGESKRSFCLLITWKVGVITDIMIRKPLIKDREQGYENLWMAFWKSSDLVIRLFFRKKSSLWMSQIKLTASKVWSMLSVEILTRYFLIDRRPSEVWLMSIMTICIFREFFGESVNEWHKRCSRWRNSSSENNRSSKFESSFVESGSGSRQINKFFAELLSWSHQVPDFDH